MLRSLGHALGGTLLAGALVMTPVAPAHAVPYGATPLLLELGDGIVAERVPLLCGAPLNGVPGCAQWQLRVNDVERALPERVNMLARTGNGRLVAALSDGVAYSDNQGVSWRRARWDSAHAPLSLAFDPRGARGAAVGSNGALWTTDNGGETWRLRRDAVGRTLVDVAVLGSTVAFSDEHGGVWLSTDGGTRVRTLADNADGTAGEGAAMPVLTVHDGALWILLHGTVWWRADEHGAIERVDAR